MYKSLYDDKGLVWLTHLDRVHLFVDLYVWTCRHHLVQTEDFIYIVFGSIFLKTYDLQYLNLINMTIKMMIILRIRKSSRRKHDCPVDQRLLAICQNNPFPLRRIRMVSITLTSSQSSVDAIDSWIAQFTNTARRVSQKGLTGLTWLTELTGLT